VSCYYTATIYSTSAVNNLDADGVYLGTEVLAVPGSSDLLRRDVLIRVDKGKATYNAVHDDVAAEPVQFPITKKNAKYSIAVPGMAIEREIIVKRKMELTIRYDVKLAFRGLIPKVSLDFLKAMFIESSYVDTCRQMNYHKTHMKAAGIAMNWKTHGSTNLDKLFDNLIKRAKGFKFHHIVDITKLSERSIPVLIMGSETGTALRAHLIGIEKKYSDAKKELNVGNLKIIAEAFDDDALLSVHKRNAMHANERSRSQYGQGDTEKLARQIHLSLINIQMGDEFHEKEFFARMMYYKYDDDWVNHVNGLNIDAKLLESYKEYINSTFKETDTKCYLESTLEPALYKQMEEKKQKLRAEIEEKYPNEGGEIDLDDEEIDGNNVPHTESEAIVLDVTWAEHNGTVYLKLEEEYYEITDDYMGTFAEVDEKPDIVEYLKLVGAKVEYKTGVSQHNPRETEVRRTRKEPYYFIVSNPALKGELACAMEFVGEGGYYMTNNIHAAVVVSGLSKNDRGVSAKEIRTHGLEQSPKMKVTFSSKIKENSKLDEALKTEVIPFDLGDQFDKDKTAARLQRKI
jgi:hypothetical protein